MKIFAIGDLHLSFGPGVEKPMDRFGEEWVNHAERLRANWMKEISPVDTVIICGDISWGLRLEEAAADFEWIRGLPGKKLLFKGNHDLWWQSAGKLNRLYGDENLIFVQNTAEIVTAGGPPESSPSGSGSPECSPPESGSPEILETPKKIAVCGSRGWICPGDDFFGQDDKKIYERELMRLEMSLQDGVKKGADEIIGVLHFPPTNDKLQPSGFTELMSSYGVKTCVYGHLHGKEVFPKGMKGIFNGVRYELVSLDYLGARPKEVRS